MSLIRLAYASEATFDAQPVEKGVEPHVARILLTSRNNNAKAKLVGGLYYGNDRFFQYLEGEEEEVRKTFDRIKRDDRHRNIITLIEEPIEARTFSNWSMKYVPLSADVRKFLERHGLDRFNPQAFSAEQCEEMIELIRDSNHDQKLVNHDEAVTAPASKPSGFSPALKFGLIAAAVCLVGALIYAGSLL
ncbi:FAD-dependent sensor of blue light [Marinobacter pelagius]|uniref:FAD-dependent sensor of blue light n=1 Tax=Marinobacter pelagius TaxID=379482 RepID=A0A366GLZ7_9GAMM|nr:BLUF domain-containing protein [Marinobacter pelagius]RBP28314.1 FAD-dependent sensor of blue light [Marinobacter pelagius]